MVISSTTVDPLSFLGCNIVDYISTAATSSSTASSSSSSTNVLSQCLGGVAHICLDFTGMTGASKLMIRLLTILGQVCVLSADYLPDHSINTLEMIIQIILMYFAVKEFDCSSSSSTSYVVHHEPCRETEGSAHPKKMRNQTKWETIRSARKTKMMAEANVRWCRFTRNTTYNSQELELLHVIPLYLEYLY